MMNIAKRIGEFVLFTTMPVWFVPVLVLSAFVVPFIAVWTDTK